MNNIKITDVRAVAGDAAFLIDDGKTAILYDTGFAFTGYKVAQNIKKILCDRDLEYIFLTHSHYDHALGAVYVKKYYPNAKIVASSYADTIFSKSSAKKVMRDLDKKFATKCGITQYEDLIDDLRVDVTVSDSDVITAGDMSFKVIALPGHTKCSVAYYCEKEKLLLSCETVGVYNGEDNVVPSFLVGYNMTLNSIKKVEKMDIDKILVPHYGVLNKDECDFYLKKAKESAVNTSNEIAQMLKNGNDDSVCIDYFINKFYNKFINTIYPIDAITLNTSIMVNLIRKEFDI